MGTVGQLSAADVRRQVDRILASPGFANAERMRRFLAFTVDAAIEGRQDELKEFVIGREVFDRDSAYDPRLDPIVRVEARRLRTRLDEYYAGPGLDDPIRIHLPKGGYVPAIAASTRPPRRLPRLRLPLMALIGIAALGVAFAVFRPRPVDATAIVPARWVWRDATGLLPADETIAELVIAEIANRGRVPVIGWPAVTAYRNHRVDSPQLAGDLHARHVLSVSVRPVGDHFRITAFLVKPATGIKVWVKDYPLPTLDADHQRPLARELAADLEAVLAFRQ